MRNRIPDRLIVYRSIINLSMSPRRLDILVYIYGCADLGVLKDNLYLLIRRVDAAVRAVTLVNIAAEAGAPVGVVNTDTAVEAHPVGNGGFVVVADECDVHGMVLNGVAAGRRVVLAVSVACYHAGVENELAVLIEPHMLLVNADFNVGSLAADGGAARGALYLDVGGAPGAFDDSVIDLAEGLYAEVIHRVSLQLVGGVSVFGGGVNLLELAVLALCHENIIARGILSVLPVEHNAVVGGSAHQTYTTRCID